MNFVVPKPALSPRALEELRAWLNGQMKSQFVHELIAAAVFVIASVCGHIAAFVVTLLVAWRGLGHAARDTGSLEVIVLIPAVILLGMYPYYYFVHKQKPLAVELSGGVARIPGNRLTPVKLFDSQAGGVGLGEFLFFPVWAVDRAFVHLGLAFKTRRADTWAMARLIGLLYAEDRRVTALDADMLLRESGLPGAIEALQVLPGVVFYADDGLSVALNDRLTEEIEGVIS